jgi:hypothetical protein
VGCITVPPVKEDGCVARRVSSTGVYRLDWDENEGRMRKRLRPVGGPQGRSGRVPAEPVSSSVEKPNQATAPASATRPMFNSDRRGKERSSLIVIIGKDRLFFPTSTCRSRSCVAKIGVMVSRSSYLTGERRVKEKPPRSFLVVLPPDPSSVLLIFLGEEASSRENEQTRTKNIPRR